MTLACPAADKSSRRHAHPAILLTSIQSRAKKRVLAAAVQPLVILASEYTKT
jgi:hypothetical protein